MEPLTLTFVNVGYGEAILLACPDPAFPHGMFTMLIDGGGAEPSEFAGSDSGRLPLHEYVRALGLDHIDLMLVTHPHEDHISGMLPVGAMLPPAVLWHTLPPAIHRETMRPLEVSLARNMSQDLFLRALNDFTALCQLAEDAGGIIRQIYPGQTGELCRGLRYTVLGPNASKLRDLEERFADVYTENEEDAFLQKLSALDAQLNNRSIILMLEYNGKRILLPGDTNLAGYDGIDPATMKADIFKVGHHGQRDGADAAVLDAVQPRYVVCCANSNRKYNSADPLLMQAISERGARRLFSDCPPVEGECIPPHHALVFTIGDDGTVDAAYR